MGLAVAPDADPFVSIPVMQVSVSKSRGVSIPAQASPRYPTAYQEGYAPYALHIVCPLIAPDGNWAGLHHASVRQWLRGESEYTLALALHRTKRQFTHAVCVGWTLTIAKNQPILLHIQCLAAAELPPRTNPTPYWTNWATLPSLLTYRNARFETLVANLWTPLTVPLYEVSITVRREVRPVTTCAVDPRVSVVGDATRFDIGADTAQVALRVAAREPDPFPEIAFALRTIIGNDNDPLLWDLRFPRLIPRNPRDTEYAPRPLYRTVQCEAIGTNLIPLYTLTP